MVAITLGENKSSSAFFPHLCIVISLGLGAVIALFLVTPAWDFPGVRPSMGHHFAFLIGPSVYEFMNGISLVCAIGAIAAGTRSKLWRWGMCQGVGLVCFAGGMMLV